MEIVLSPFHYLSPTLQEAWSYGALFLIARINHNYARKPGAN